MSLLLHDVFVYGLTQCIQTDFSQFVELNHIETIGTWFSDSAFGRVHVR